MNRKGLTLIELLVAVICTTLVAYIAWDLVRDEQTNYTRTREKVRLQSDAKEAMRIIEGEMRNLGYNEALVTGADRRYVSLTECVGANDARIDVAGGDFSSFLYTNNTTVPGGDQIEFRMHQGVATGMTNCAAAATPLQSISYRYNDGRLERRFCQDADVASCATDGTWLPFLESVVSFHVQYGVEVADDGVQFSNAAYATPGNWDGGQMTSNLSVAAGDTNISFTAFTAARSVTRFEVPVPIYRRGDTYLVTYRIQANNAWLQDGETFGAGFFDQTNALDAPATDTFSVQPGLPVAGSTGWDVSMVFHPAVDTADGLRFFGFYGRLKPVQVAATPPSITIRNLQIRRISQGKYIQWIEAPTLAEKNRVRAVRVSLVVKSRKSDAEPAPGTFSEVNLGQTGVTYTPSGADVGYSYILMQRIVPVVNNGNF